jgi:predicted nucleotidyltransferase
VEAALQRSLAAFGDRVRSHFGERVVLLRLFGSCARGDADPDSDADVAVVIRDLAEPERTAIIDLALDAWRTAGRLGPVLAPLVWSEVEWLDRSRAERRIATDIHDEGLAF